MVFPPNGLFAACRLVIQAASHSGRTAVQGPMGRQPRLGFHGVFPWGFPQRMGWFYEGKCQSRWDDPIEIRMRTTGYEPPIQEITTDVASMEYLGDFLWSLYVSHEVVRIVEIPGLPDRS